jgi:thiol:disulfide interchange protein DsbA
MQARYGIMGVPSMVINGKYRTSGSEAGSLENVIHVVEALVEQERKAMLSEATSQTE